MYYLLHALRLQVDILKCNCFAFHNPHCLEIKARLPPQYMNILKNTPKDNYELLTYMTQILLRSSSFAVVALLNAGICN